MTREEFVHAIENTGHFCECGNFVRRQFWYFSGEKVDCDNVIFEFIPLANDWNKLHQPHFKIIVKKSDLEDYK